MLRSAAERQFQVVGEALRVTLQHNPEVAASITDVRAIIAFRNQLRRPDRPEAAGPSPVDPANLILQ